MDFLKGSQVEVGTADTPLIQGLHVDLLDVFHELMLMPQCCTGCIIYFVNNLHPKSSVRTLQLPRLLGIPKKGIKHQSRHLTLRTVHSSKF